MYDITKFERTKFLSFAFEVELIQFAKIVNYDPFVDLRIKQ